jgi:hypothetical protein
MGVRKITSQIDVTTITVIVTSVTAVLGVIITYLKFRKERDERRKEFNYKIVELESVILQKKIEERLKTTQMFSKF